MTMNYSRAIFVISDDVRAVNCIYEPDREGHRQTRTMFKTLDKRIKEGDFVVVPTDTRHQMTVVKVAEVDIEPDLDGSLDVSWIIGVVDRADFEAIKGQENVAITKIKDAEKRKRRRELREAMLDENADEELKALPIYTVPDAASAEAE